ncbi:MAG: hypothetical protein SWK76_09490 [Actinomycetota bacterium]|nr:hypothetical protein [Actinomycetota bacterium]
MYFKYSGGGGHCVAGAWSVDDEWCFVERCTRCGFEEWLRIANPNAETARIRIDFLDGRGECTSSTYHIMPDSRFTLSVNEALGGKHDVSARISCDAGIVAERPIYFLFASRAFQRAALPPSAFMAIRG